MTLGTLLGRSSETSHLADLVPGSPVVTVVGAAGVGKTRLVEHVATVLTNDFSDGLRTVDLTGIDPDDHAATSIVSALGFRTLDAALANLAGATALVVFDNCEHVIDTVGEIVGAIVAASPDVRVLATSRRPLETPGEVVVPLRPLAVEAAVKLLRQRAREAGADLASDAASDQVLADLATRVDALPLAIELAAIRLRSLSPQHVVDALDESIELLSRGRGPDRHGSVSAAIAWSYGLLDSDTADAFRRLAVLSPPFDFERAHAVISAAGDDRVRTATQLDLLVSQSLLSSRNVDGVVRYRLLETVRQFARAELHDEGDLPGTRERYVSFVDDFTQDLVRRAVERWTDDVVADTIRIAPDLLAAVRSCLDHDDDGRRACRIYLPGWGLVHDLHAGELAELGAELMTTWAADSTPGWGDVAAITATASVRLFDFDRAEEQANAALAAGGLIAEPVARRALAMVAQHRGRFAEALELVHTASEVASRDELTPFAAELRVFEATLLAQLGHIDRAVEAARDARILNRRLASLPVSTWSLLQEAYILADVDPDRSAELVEVVEQEVEPGVAQYIVGRHLGIIEIKRGRIERAAVWLRGALTASLSASETPHTWAALRWIAVAGILSDGPVQARAAQLFAITETSPQTPAPGVLERTVLDGAVALAGERITPRTTQGPVALAFEILDEIDDRAAGNLRQMDEPSRERPGAGPATPQPRGTLIRSGEIWTLVWQGRQAELPTSKGLVDLATLLARQGAEVHALELMGSGFHEAGVDASIDDAAKQQFESRLRELQAELSEAEEFNDMARAEQAQVEFDRIVDELAGAYGLSGRQRTYGGSADRARSAVTWRIRAAIRKIDQHLPGLARHLRASVKTGTWCSYDPEESVDWRLE